LGVWAGASLRKGSAHEEDVDCGARDCGARDCA
jgi:hypothetical protein